MVPHDDEGQTIRAYQAGRRAGFGIAALALGIITYLSLLGTEKAVLAIVLGVMALRGQEPNALAKRLGIVSIVLGAVFVVTVPVMLFLFWDKVSEFVAALQSLS